MNKNIKYREISKGEEEDVCKLIMDCFGEFVAPGYSQEGIDEFSKYVTPSFTSYRLTHNHFMIIALDDDKIVGVIEARNSNHISLFFVHKEYQNTGIGKTLNELVIKRCKTSDPDITSIEVHSSPYAVPIYEKLRFVKMDTEQLVHGIRFIPMIFHIK